MSFAQYSLITQVIFGEGSVSALADIVKESTNSGQVAIITDDETCISQLDFLQQALRNLDDNTNNSVLDDNPHTKGSPRPVFKAANDLTMETVAQVASELNECAKRGLGLIAIGGDYAMYLAKSVAAMMATPGITNLNNANKSGLIKVFCIPTNPGTGSELISEVILTGAEKPVNLHICRAAGLAPDWTVYDTQLIAITPGNLVLEKAAAGLCQAIEALVAVGSSEVTEALAISAAKNLGLIQNRFDGGCSYDRELLCRVTNGTMLAALARQNAAHGAAQGLARWFTAGGQGQDQGQDQGQGQGRQRGRYAALAAALLPLVMRYNMPQSHEKYAILAGIWGLGSRGDSVDQAAQAIRHIMNFNRRAGIPAQLRAFGFAKEVIVEAVEQARIAGLLEGNPRPVNSGAFAAVLEEGW